MELSTLEELLVEEIKDLYSAEKQLIKALPKMAKAASHPELKAAFQEHLEQTREHAARLEQVFELLGQKPKAKTCKAMEGLVEEGAEMIGEDAEDDVKDAGLIAAAQKVEHYEIASYGTVRAYAEIMGHEEVMEILAQTLEEEKETDVRLTELAMSSINLEAVEDEDGEEGDEEEEEETPRSRSNAQSGKKPGANQAAPKKSKSSGRR